MGDLQFSAQKIKKNALGYFLQKQQLFSSNHLVTLAIEFEPFQLDNLDRWLRTASQFYIRGFESLILSEMT